jgi:hypothetical protein
MSADAELFQHLRIAIETSPAPGLQARGQPTDQGFRWVGLASPSRPRDFASRNCSRSGFR